MASRKLLAPRTAVYQDGRGSEPMMDVGRVFPADALNIFLKSFFNHGAEGAECERVCVSTSAAPRTAEHSQLRRSRIWRARRECAWSSSRARRNRRRN